VHAYRIARGVTLVEFEPIEGEIPEEVQPQEEPKKEDRRQTFQSALTTDCPPF
jgi:hypothetical protein